MKLHVIDGDGTAAVIHDDLEIESEDPISTELRRFLERTERDREGPVSLESLEAEFLVELYVETPVRRVEPASERRRVRWERPPARYGPPTGERGERTETGSVGRGDGFEPDSPSRSPSADGADGADE
ncbi:hypothetical protein [Saliphagus sp. LR7]|uniref:hypothetical protein n=1 Tax=Saliphagus sp. LR7 TaxID=2282654 RepID=UPI000DF7BD6F|nr:hypothetical protein [Saliphagus sp. LR7]